MDRGEPSTMPFSREHLISGMRDLGMVIELLSNGRTRTRHGNIDVGKTL